MRLFSRRSDLRPSRLDVPRLNDSLADVEKIARLFSEANRWSDKGVTLPLDFSACDFLRPTAVAAIGGIVAHVNAKGGTAPILRNTLQPAVREALTKNGFLAAHGIEAPRYANNAVAYRHDLQADADGFAEFLSEEWLGRNWIDLGREVRQEIIQSVVELHNNAFEHGKPRTGFFTCGQKFPKQEEVVLAFLDFGLTIPATVKSLAANAQMSDQEAISWALHPGHTSKTGFSRGLGFDVLVDLVSGQDSHMEIYSGRGSVRSMGRHAAPKPLSFLFPGTLIQLTVNTASIRKMLAERPTPIIRF